MSRKLKAKRASETEEQRKEGLQEEKIRSSETKDHEEREGMKSYKKYISCFSHSSLYAPNNLHLILIVAFNKMHYY